MRKINPSIHIQTIHEQMLPDSKISDLIKPHDFVVNTLDEPYIGYTAAKVSRACIQYRIPHYIAGGFDAHLASTGELIIPFVTLCVECYASHFKQTLKTGSRRVIRLKIDMIKSAVYPVCLCFLHRMPVRKS